MTVFLMFPLCLLYPVVLSAHCVALYRHLIVKIVLIIIEYFVNLLILFHYSVSVIFAHINIDCKMNPFSIVLIVKGYQYLYTMCLIFLKKPKTFDIRGLNKVKYHCEKMCYDFKYSTVFTELHILLLYCN